MVEGIRGGWIWDKRVDVGREVGKNIRWRKVGQKYNVEVKVNTSQLGCHLPASGWPWATAVWSGCGILTCWSSYKWCKD